MVHAQWSRGGLASMINRRLARRLAQLAVATASAIGGSHAPVLAQPAAGAPPSVDCPDNDAACLERKKREEEAAERAGSTEGAAGLVFGGGSIVPCVGAAPNVVCGDAGPPVVSRGPLSVRRLDLSVGIDHALSPRWVVGALVGVGRGRVHRIETVSAGSTVNSKNTTIRTRNATIAALLTWFPVTDISVDGSLSLQRAKLDFERFDSLGGRRFIGDNAGRAWSATLSASRAWRGEGVALVPQAGLVYVDNRVDPLRASIPDPPPGSVENLTVSQQRAKALSALFEAQAQWPRSRSFGVLVPYARLAWRERVSYRGDPVVTQTGDNNGRTTTDLETQTARRTGTLAAGVLAVLANRMSLFGDLGYTRGSGDLREARLSLGLKFEL
jgi:hypothetical protein